MPSLLQNTYIRFGIFGFGAFLVLIILLSVLSSLTGFNVSNDLLLNTNNTATEPSFDGGTMMSDTAMEQSYKVAPSMARVDFNEDGLSNYYPEPSQPASGGFTSELESFETTSYNLSARSRDFDELCDTLTTLKAEDTIHFKQISSGLNNCNARFFVEEDRVTGVISQFENFKGVEINRNTNSVTRHKEQIESRTNIVRKQLASVDRTLAEAEVAFDEIVEFARQNKDAETLSSAIRNKLQQIDYLTGRKINLTSQLENYAQQSMDLNERLDVVEFYANFSRSKPVQLGKNEQLWESAWTELGDHFTKTLIGITAFFGIFLLYVVQYGLYLLVLIIAARLGWKVVKKVWKV